MHLLISVLVLVLCSSIASSHDRDEEDNWPMYGRNLQHTFSNSNSHITPENVSNLKLAWTFPTGDAVSASPTVSDGVVYIGSWDGFFYALKVRTDKLLWKFQADCDTAIIPVPVVCGGPNPSNDLTRFFTDGGVITSSAAVVDDKVYFAAGKTIYSLNAADGSLRWKRVICGYPDDPSCASNISDPTKIFSSPAVFGGSVFIGYTADGNVGYRGGFIALDAETGKTRWRFELDPKLDAKGNIIGAFNRGCGNVWSSPAIDAKHHLVFFGTSDCNDDATPPYHESVIALETKTGNLRWVFRPRETDLHLCDFDFGASPNVIDIGKGHFIGIGSKDGTYYLLQRLTHNPKGQLVWAKNVVFGGMSGGFYGAAAFDGAHIFSATGIGDGNPFTNVGLCDPSNTQDTFIQDPSMHALNAANGGILWEQSYNHSFAATSVADGVVFSGLVGIEPPALNAYNAQSGKLLVSFHTKVPGSVNSSATPVGNMLFVTSGNSSDGSGSAIHAFMLP